MSWRKTYCKENLFHWKKTEFREYVYVRHVLWKHSNPYISFLLFNATSALEKLDKILAHDQIGSISYKQHYLIYSICFRNEKIIIDEAPSSQNNTASYQAHIGSINYSLLEMIHCCEKTYKS